MKTLDHCKRQFAELSKKHKYIIQYFRTSNRTPVGALVAWKDENGEIRWGWSKCNVKLDRYNRYLGILKAIKRGSVEEALPDSMYETYEHFMKRVKKYFKCN